MCGEIVIAPLFKAGHFDKSSDESTTPLLSELRWY